MNETGLIEIVLQGNADRFGELTDRYLPAIYRFLLRQTGDRTDAEDLAQEVFLRVYRARDRYVPGAKFSTWLFTIAHNVANNAIRKQAYRKEINLVNSPSGQYHVRPLDRMAKAKSGLMPTRQADRKEMTIIVQHAIQTLNKRQKMALLLSKFEGMSYVEIAEAMGLTTQAVKSLLSRARNNLREILDPYLESGQLPAGAIPFEVPEGTIDPS